MEIQRNKDWKWREGLTERTKNSQIETEQSHKKTKY